LIQYSAPVWVALLGQWFLGERATRIDWLAIVLVLGGITLFFVEEITLDHAAGNLVALAAGVAFAFSGLSMRRVAVMNAGTLDPLRPLLLGNILGALAGAPFWFTGPLPDLAGWSALLALGILQQAAAYLCYAAAIRHATALEAILVPVIEPVLSPLWVMIFIGEMPGTTAYIGGAIVVGAVTLRSIFARHPSGTGGAEAP
jgi:drug/metabolite transporter (DMT)-like permease